MLEAEAVFYARMFECMYLQRALPQKRHELLKHIYIELQQFEQKLSQLEERLGFKAGYNPNQPRVPAGSPDGGQWASEETGAVSSNHSKPHADINKAIDHLIENANASSLGQCAKYVRRALNAGGFDVKPVAYAKDVGAELERVGFKPIIKKYKPAEFPTLGYQETSGDIAIIQPTTRNTAGHIAMYDGTGWVSDFRQRNFWPGSLYAKEKPDYVIYRYQ